MSKRAAKITALAERETPIPNKPEKITAHTRRHSENAAINNAFLKYLVWHCIKSLLLINAK